MSRRREPSPPRAALGILRDALSVAAERDASLRTRLADGGIDWDQVLHLAGSHLVTPALAGAVERKAVTALLPAAVRDYLTAIRDLNGQRNGILGRELARVAAALNARGVVPILLKGALALLPGQYPGAEDRVIGDLDLLVEPAEHGAAREAVIGLGYDEAEGAWRRMTARDRAAMHHGLPLLHPTLPVKIELHSRVTRDEAGAAELRGSLRPAPVTLPGGARALVPGEVARLLHNFHHSQIQDQMAARRLANLRQLLEFAQLLAAAGGARREELTSALPQSWRLRFAEYAAMAEAWLGAPYPEGLPRSPAARRELWLTERVTVERHWGLASDAVFLAARAARRARHVLRPSTGQAA